jgi:hypothetical protein
VCQKVTLKVELMKNSLVQRRERPLKLEPIKNGKAKVLRFDRRVGIVLMEKVSEKADLASATKPVGRLTTLVRMLLRLGGPGDLGGR